MKIEIILMMLFFYDFVKNLIHLLILSFFSYGFDWLLNFATFMYVFFRGECLGEIWIFFIVLRCRIFFWRLLVHRLHRGDDKMPKLQCFSEIICRIIFCQFLLLQLQDKSCLLLIYLFALEYFTIYQKFIQEMDFYWV